MPSVLLVAYGNVSRRDDGVAMQVVRLLGAKIDSFEENIECEDEYRLNDDVAILYTHQLVPEMVETLAQYDYVVFIDAHIQTSKWEPIHWQEIVPAYKSSMVTHHLKPNALLALCISLYGRSPRGYILSVLGTDFDFGEGLSPQTSELADEAAFRLQAWLDSGCSTWS